MARFENLTVNKFKALRSEPNALEMNADAVVPKGVESIEFGNTVNTDVTIPDAKDHKGLLVMKATVEPATDHSVTLTVGTFDGTNNVATFADILDTLVVYIDENGDGTILVNVGTVVLS